MIQGGNLPRIKIQNQCNIRKMIYMHGPILRSEIAEQLGLTVPTITTNINGLIKLGIIENVKDTQHQSNSLGRKASPVDIIPDSRYFIGLEMRRTFRHLCVTDYRGHMIFSSSDHTVYDKYDDNVHSVGLLLKNALENLPVPQELIAGVGIAAPGIIDSDTGILQAHKKYEWYNKPILDDIASISGYHGPMIVGNNAYARALSQQLFHKNVIHNVSSFVYLFISSGIACPFILCDSNSLSTPIGPGEIGYTVVKPSETTEPFGDSVLLSDISGERAMLERCTTLIHNGEAPYLAEICKGNSPTLDQVLLAQEHGEPKVDDVIHTAIHQLGITLSNVDNFIRPEMMLIDAHIFKYEKNKEALISAINNYTFRPHHAAPKIVFIEHNEFSGAFGGAALAVRKDFDQYLDAEES